MLRELEHAAGQLGIRVRYEKGSFQGGLCIVNGEPCIVLNKLHPPELQFSVLATGLQGYDLESLYLPPAIREALEKAWQRTANLLMEPDPGPAGTTAP